MHAVRVHSYIGEVGRHFHGALFVRTGQEVVNEVDHDDNLPKLHEEDHPSDRS